ncbi:hypothetical protein FBZ84_101136 [Azospirillum baldaniorum]|uniref:hypothetical protein n=1 Tax=Azospirillum baldaniorum TaxID=1064539 RepID=UPI0011AA737B|nr:hypothetical protein [Azospirillum baldaniorum]TWA71870.1 hypothetical protein FBZ84_101136 [Azospirillum baldaniorum]
MLMTEEEAAWTPCAGNENCGRVVATSRVPKSVLDGGRNLTKMFGGRVERRFCEGSACTAWRETAELRNPGPEGKWVKVGYCGAFGKPEAA